ncbi:TPA: hypothetical protein ACH3X2_006335 [Trebouxia sp. C0005]
MLQRTEAVAPTLPPPPPPPPSPQSPNILRTAKQGMSRTAPPQTLMMMPRKRLTPAGVEVQEIATQLLHLAAAGVVRVRHPLAVPQLAAPDGPCFDEPRLNWHKPNTEKEGGQQAPASKGHFTAGEEAAKGQMVEKSKGEKLWWVTERMRVRLHQSCHGAASHQGRTASQRALFWAVPSVKLYAPEPSHSMLSMPARTHASKQGPEGQEGPAQQR